MTLEEAAAIVLEWYEGACVQRVHVNPVELDAAMALLRGAGDAARPRRGLPPSGRPPVGAWVHYQRPGDPVCYPAVLLRHTHHDYHDLVVVGMAIRRDHQVIGVRVRDVVEDTGYLLGYVRRWHRIERCDDVRRFKEEHDIE